MGTTKFTNLQEKSYKIYLRFCSYRRPLTTLSVLHLLSTSERSRHRSTPPSSPQFLCRQFKYDKKHFFCWCWEKKVYKIYVWQSLELKHCWFRRKDMSKRSALCCRELKLILLVLADNAAKPKAIQSRHGSCYDTKLCFWATYI